MMTPLLLCVILNQDLKKLIDEGMVYIALPPLYKVTVKSSKQKEYYVWEEDELRELTSKFSNYEIQRYKGLGEMNADQLWETTMNPATRSIIRVRIVDEMLAERSVNTLMSDDVIGRKAWINAFVDFSNEDDFVINDKK